MTTRRPASLFCLAGCASLLAVPALAQDDGRFYGGLSLGQTRAHYDEQGIADRFLRPGLSSTLTVDARDTGYRLFGGHRFNRNFAVELGVVDLGRSSFTVSTIGAGALQGELKARGLNLDAIGLLPLGNGFTALGRAGLLYAQTRDRFSGTNAASNPAPRQRHTGYTLGAGLQYDVNPAFLVRAEATRYRVGDGVGGHGDIDLFSVSLVFPFGHAPTPRAVPALAAVAAAPQPEPLPAPAAVVSAPEPVVAAAPAPRSRVSLSADSLFAFDQAAVGPAGQAALDAFAAQTQGTQFDRVNVEGHTDRLGSPAYNQRLSVQRAEAVKAYLVGSRGFDAARVAVEGKGESSPVTKPGECKGQRATPELIACLQPDRRVDVEVTGTR